MFVTPKRGTGRNVQSARVPRRRRELGSSHARLVSPPAEILQPLVVSPSSDPAVRDTIRAVSGNAGCRANCDASQPYITTDVRERLVSALSSLRGKKGAPFSFVTSGNELFLDQSHESADPTDHNQPARHHQQKEPASIQQQTGSFPLKLSWLLRPLKANDQLQGRPYHADTGHDGDAIKMPTYLSSTTLSQTISDPIDSGILSRAASVALFNHFMTELNAKWEYVLDPRFDTHDSVRARNQLLFATILFCSSKFFNFFDQSVTTKTDPHLQVRLCGVARSLAVNMFAAGDRSTETMQALYLLACWKDADDDISYMHSAYAFRILQDLDLEQTFVDRSQTARRRAWLALYRQDKQQSLFFMEKRSHSLGADDVLPIIDKERWLSNSFTLPSDFVACCSADIRRLQFKLSVMVRKSSTAMLPCLLELMDSDLRVWESKWRGQLTDNVRRYPRDDDSLDAATLGPDSQHNDVLLGLWKHSVRLNVASAILRQIVTASVASYLRTHNQPLPPLLSLDLPAIESILPSDAPGLWSSVEGAFETLRHLLKFPVEDLRRAPDAVVLLGPNAALFLCLLLCLPTDGILGPAFQQTAIGLIQDIALHIAQAVQSPHDTIRLHSKYMDSLVALLQPGELPCSSQGQDLAATPETENMRTRAPSIDSFPDATALQQAQVSTGSIGGLNYDHIESSGMENRSHDFSQDLDAQSLAILLDFNFPWELQMMNGAVH